MRQSCSGQCTERPRLLAVDWSGAARGAERHIWLAEAQAGARSLIRLEDGRGREVLVEHLLAQASAAPRLVIGLDFAFSFPAWFCEQLGVQTAADLWTRVARHGEAWLATCQPPF